MELFRQRHPEAQVAYTFFSPSAEQFASTVGADFFDYLPFDTSRNASAVIDALRPTALVFSKLDVWPLLVESAAKRGVKLGLLSATVPASSLRTSRLARLALSDAYHALDTVGAVSRDDASRLVRAGVRSERLTVTGDTRYDQAWARAQRVVSEQTSLVMPLRAPRFTLVAGSTWPADEEHLLPAWLDVRKAHRDARLLIAPHELSKNHLARLDSWAGSKGLSSSRVNRETLELDARRAGSSASVSADVLIVDAYGILGDLYALADIAYVGGGFGDAGLHSLLEPAAYGAPVIMGPRHTDNRDAALLVAAGGAFRCADRESIANRIQELMDNPDSMRAAGAAALEVVRSGLGAAELSVSLVEQLMVSKS
jgi:3-deoxy-D-manno-octulosonic-acid transferase